jgi:hypothetical protein
MDCLKTIEVNWPLALNKTKRPKTRRVRSEKTKIGSISTFDKVGLLFPKEVFS